MPIIHPCRHCPERPTCATRKGAAAAMAPLKVTLARLSCPIYDAMFAPGDRVASSIGGISKHRRFTVNGTILHASAKKRGRWLVQVDADDVDKTGLEDDYGDSMGHRPFIAVFPDRMIRLDEPKRQICKLCGNAKGPDGEHIDTKGANECDGVRSIGGCE